MNYRFEYYIVKFISLMKSNPDDKSEVNMKTRVNFHFLILIVLLSTNTLFIPIQSQTNSDLDEKVKTFLDVNEDNWHDLNVPTEDGQLLYDIIVKNNYKHAVEIGTSTGHSAIWIAWALSKTGGMLITIEINEDRYNEALENFKEAGVSEFIDARLADAHKLVKELKGPIDFIFSDADKDWYKNYFIDLDPKLIVGGCFTAHNVINLRRSAVQEFLDHVESLPNYETTIDNSSRAGVSISYKKSKK